MENYEEKGSEILEEAEGLLLMSWQNSLKCAKMTKNSEDIVGASYYDIVP